MRRGALRRFGALLSALTGLMVAVGTGGCSERADGAVATRSRHVDPPPKPKGKGNKAAIPRPVDKRSPVQIVSEALSKLQCPPPGVQPVKGEITLPLPPFSEGIFPCDECHADMAPKARRKLTEAHTEIKLSHGPKTRWCYDCHNKKPRNTLRLASGAPVDFKKSHLLCGQCHGPKLRDWRLGLHGKRFGNWRGMKCNLLCAHCHNPHAPRFKGIRPLPPPTKPIHIR